MRGQFILIGSALFFASSVTAAAADQASICAARPGKSTPPCTVPAGRLQLETGLVDWTLDKRGGAKDTSLVIGETSFKFGLTDGSDIEMDVAPWQRSTSRSGGLRDRASGFGDVTVAYKRQLTARDSSVQIAALPFVKVPTAKHSLGNGKWEAGLVVPIGAGIPNTPFSIGATPELDWAADGDGSGHHLAKTQVASLGWAASHRLGISAEFWGNWDLDPDGTKRRYSADGSIAYLVSNDLQIDAGANFGLNRQTPDLELYAGIARRF
jgi:hypothetical protein